MWWGLEVAEETVGVEEVMLVECRNLLLSVMLHVDINDAWRWTPNPIAKYMVGGTYRILTARLPSIDPVPAALFWRKDVPLKITVFTWRLFRHRLFTKANLYCRDIIPLEAQMCVAGYDFQESDNHFFSVRESSFLILSSVWSDLIACWKLTLRLLNRSI